MSYDTTIRAMSAVDHRLMFLKARQVVGIPDEWPFDDRYDGAQHIVASKVGGFDAHVRVYAHDFEAIPEDDEDYGPRPCFADLHLQTSGGDRYLYAKHDRYITAIGAWLDSQNVAYAVMNSRGDWRHVDHEPRAA